MKEPLFHMSVVVLTIIAMVITACSSSDTPEPTEQPITEEQSLELAMDFVKNSKTYTFDGIEDTLQLTETLYPDIENCWQFVFEFDSSYAGYGDRTGQMLAQVITPHEAIITVEDGAIKSAVLDGTWDMINQQTLDDTSQTDITIEQSQEVALDYLLNSPTFVFDGMEDTVELIETITARCPYCWVFEYEFQSRHAGYGDRTGQMLAQVITSHRASIAVDKGTVTRAIMDDKWNMMIQEFFDQTSSAMMTVADLMKNPRYEQTVTIQGEVSLLGELFCPCFELSSGGQKVQIWYGLMVDDDGTELSSVDVEGIENGDWVQVTGKLKKAGTHSSLNDFWAESVSIADRPVNMDDTNPNDILVGGTPGSCGYSWDPDRYGWHRVWEEGSFIPADEKPEWEKYIPDDDQTSEPDLSGGKWNLLSFGDQSDPTSVLEKTSITIEITQEDNGLSVEGSAGCNRYFGSFKIIDNGMEAGMIGSTEMWCMDEDVMDQEAAFLKALGSVTDYEIDGDTLKMTYEGGVLVFTAD